MKDRILVVDDEASVTSFLRPMLERAGFEVAIGRDGEQALELARTWKPDLIVLDIRMPKRDGLEVCRELRSRGPYMPIIILSALDHIANKAEAVALGADVYFSKRIEPQELVLQVKATLRTVRMVQESRNQQYSGRLVCADLEIDLDSHEVFTAGRKVHLTKTEYKLLVFLAQNPGTVFERDELLDAVKGKDAVFIFARTIDRHISGLRKKLEPDPSDPQYILTERGAGYRFREC